MPSLLDCPNEIVIPIIDLVHAEDTDDIVSFSCCNKRISLLSEGMLKKHKEMKEYRELEFGNHTNHQTIDVGLFLRAILNNEALARYPTKIHIRECFGTFYDRSRTWQWEEHDVTVAALADCRDAILAKIEACPYIEPRMQGCWTRNIFNGKESTVVPLLMLYLPNLRSITISNSIGNLSFLRQLISNIATANRTNTQNLPTPLSKLSHLRLEFEDTRSSVFKTSLPDWLRIVAGLPSLRRLSGKAVNGHCSNRTEPCPGTELTAINFTSSDIDVKIFRYILSRTKSLQTFTYSYEGLPHNRANWEPRTLVQLLHTHAAHSLKTLDLTSLSDAGPHNAKPDATFVDCLHGFRVLKQVRLDHNMFIENPPIPKFKATKAYRPNTLDLELYVLRHGHAEKTIHRLVDLLPVSIETVDLVSPLRGKVEALAMMDGLPELKQSRLPRLKGLRLEVDDEMDGGMKASFKEAGVRLV